MSYPELVKTCEEVWSVIRDTNIDVPQAIVVVGSGGRKAGTTLGHFARDRWDLDGEPVHEVLIVAEQLNRGAEDIFTTLLHEAVHGIATVREIKDVSGKRHNKKFRELCVEVGMIPPEKSHPSLGFSEATLGEDLLALYSPQIKALDNALSFYRKLVVAQGEKKKSLWAAECDCGRKIRLGKKAISDPEVLEIECKTCESPFTLTEDYDG